ncbi:hypothetical protein Scel_76520 [Streptomyces cellostaticus]|nr:hypothetical protein Scel_76520 [Streptomyces cellostaticus]
MPAAVRAAQLGDEIAVGLPRQRTGAGRERWAWGVGGVHETISFPAAGRHTKGRPVGKQCLIGAYLKGRPQRSVMAFALPWGGSPSHTPLTGNKKFD